jgi:hypothetical protein
MKVLSASKLCIVFICCIVFSFLSFPSQTYAQSSSCQTPAAITGVTITYPDCSDTTCNFNQGTCTWNSSANAANYTVVVTNAGSGTGVYNQSVPAGTTKVAFPVTNGQTYKCDVTGVNSCGQNGATGTQTLLCQVDQAASPSPTTPPVVNQPPPVQLPATGMFENTLLFGGISLFLIIVGSFFVLS